MRSGSVRHLPGMSRAVWTGCRQLGGEGQGRRALVREAGRVIVMLAVLLA
jgi:hypothetical protein